MNIIFLVKNEYSTIAETINRADRGTIGNEGSDRVPCATNH